MPPSWAMPTLKTKPALHWRAPHLPYLEGHRTWMKRSGTCSGMHAKHKSAWCKEIGRIDGEQLQARQFQRPAPTQIGGLASHVQLRWAQRLLPIVDSANFMSSLPPIALAACLIQRRWSLMQNHWLRVQDWREELSSSWTIAATLLCQEWRLLRTSEWRPATAYFTTTFPLPQTV